LLNIIGSYETANFLNIAAAKDVIGDECNEKLLQNSSIMKNKELYCE
jgi:hypothetical protein